MSLLRGQRQNFLDKKHAPSNATLIPRADKGRKTSVYNDLRRVLARGSKGLLSMQLGNGMLNSQSPTDVVPWPDQKRMVQRTLAIINEMLHVVFRRRMTTSSLCMHLISVTSPKSFESTCQHLETLFLIVEPVYSPYKSDQSAITTSIKNDSDWPRSQRERRRHVHNRHVHERPLLISSAHSHTLPPPFLSLPTHTNLTRP